MGRILTKEIIEIQIVKEFNYRTVRAKGAHTFVNLDGASGSNDQI